MTPEIAQILAIVVVTMILFSLERIPADVIALGALLAVNLLGLIPPDRAFFGFGSEAVMMILGLLVLTAALVRTGVVDILGRLMQKRFAGSERKILLFSMIAPGLVSSLMSNTAAAAFFLPMLIGLARQARVNISKVLMPLAFSAILASSVTLIGTSTNIVVSGLMVQQGLEPIGMFELTPVGFPILLTGIGYLLTIGQKLLPARANDDDAVQRFKSQTYITEAILVPNSRLAGKTLAETNLGRQLDITVLQVIKKSGDHLPPSGDMLLQDGDILLVEGERDDILRIKQVEGVDIRANYKFQEANAGDQEFRLVEAIVLNRSPLIGRTLVGARFRELYNLQVLAINRHGETFLKKLSQVRIQVGDILLIQGEHPNVAALEADDTFHILGAVIDNQPRPRRALTATLIFLGVLALATFDFVSFSVAALLGVLGVFITRCITPEEAYRGVEWRALILIGSMITVGYALESTGAAGFLANQIVQLVGSANPVWLLGGFFILTMVITQPMSNQAAAAIVVPIALQTALHLHLNPRPFGIMIAIAASCSFLTPLEPACLMVYGPGRYRFSDFLKVGALLTLFIFIIAIILVPLLWPLNQL